MRQTGYAGQQSGRRDGRGSDRERMKMRVEEKEGEEETFKAATWEGGDVG